MKPPVVVKQAYQEHVLPISSSPPSLHTLAGFASHGACYRARQAAAISDSTRHRMIFGLLRMYCNLCSTLKSPVSARFPSCRDNLVDSRRRRHHVHSTLSFRGGLVRLNHMHFPSTLCRFKITSVTSLGYDSQHADKMLMSSFRSNLVRQAGLVCSRWCMYTLSLQVSSHG